MIEPSLEQRLSAYLKADSETSRERALEGASAAERQQVCEQASDIDVEEATSLPHDGLGWTGRQLGRYLIRREIARGGMAVVYEATEDESEKCVAIKVPRDDLSPEAREQSFRLIALEHQIASTVNSAHLVRVHHVGQNRDVPYLVMERIGESFRRGGARTLQEIIARKCYRDSDAKRWMKQLLGTVRSLHHAGFAHRDIKAENILIDSKDQLRLIDFGISKDLNSSSAIHTMKDFGTPGSVPRPTGDAIENAIRRDIYACSKVMLKVFARSNGAEEEKLVDIHGPKWVRIDTLIESMQNSHDGKAHAIDQFDREYRRLCSSITSHPAVLACASVAAITLAGLAYSRWEAEGKTLGVIRGHADSRQPGEMTIVEPSGPSMPNSYLKVFDAIYAFDWPLAESQIDRMQESEPVWAELARAWMWLYRENPERALSTLDSINAEQLQGLVGWKYRLVRAKSLRAAGRTAEARDAFQLMTRYQPQSPRHYYDIAEAYAYLGRLEMADKMVRIAAISKASYVGELATSFPAYADYLAEQQAR